MEKSEALEIVRKNWPDGRHQLSEALETLIPELKESDDERIRREIIADIQKHHPCWQLYKDYTSWIDWLERLGDRAFSVERLFAEAGIKPAYKDSDSWCVLIGENIQEGICGFGETPEDAYVNFLKELWGKAFGQKTSEWSEDDNAKIEFLCNLIKRNISEGTYSFGDGAKNGFVSKHEAIKMLESLKSRVQPQPKSEWNNNDEINFNRLMAICADERVRKSSAFSEKEIKDLMAWFESIKKRVQPQWKPSDEQMYALQHIIACYHGDYEHLADSFYNDLKKLKG